MGWVEEPCISIEFCDGVVLCITQLKVVDLEILCKPRDLGGLRNDDMAAMQTPVETNLTGRFSILGSDFLDYWLFKKV